jgi:hypothetical protein
MAIVLKADLLKTARRLAKQSGEDFKGWKKSDFEQYLLEHPEWKTVLEVSWRKGSFAGIAQLGKEMYKSYDDAGTYGPYTSFDEASSHVPIPMIRAKRRMGAR